MTKSLNFRKDPHAIPSFQRKGCLLQFCILAANLVQYGILYAYGNFQLEYDRGIFVVMVFSLQVDQ